MNRTTLEKVHCMLSHAGLSKNLWAEAAHTACYLVNRFPHASLEGKVPEEIWTGKQPDYSNLRIFGCLAYAHVNHGKLNPRAMKCIFVGYPDEVKGYRLFCPETKKIINSRDVTFNENALLSSRKESAGNSPDAGTEKVEMVTSSLKSDDISSSST